MPELSAAVRALRRALGQLQFYMIGPDAWLPDPSMPNEGCRKLIGATKSGAQA